MKGKDLRANAISVEKFLRNYCLLMPYPELLGLEKEAYNLLEMYHIVDGQVFETFCSLNINTLRLELKNLGIKTRGVSFESVKVGDILTGDVLVVSDHYGNIFAFDWMKHNDFLNNEICDEKPKILKRSDKNDKYKRRSKTKCFKS